MSGAPLQAPDKTRWGRLSPLLDELLDLGEADRSERLATLRLQDAALADELQALLSRLPALDAEAFLESPAMPRETSLAGRVVGAYTLERELGEGGMGSVWLARRTDGLYEGQVAIKFLHAGLLARGDAERFAREGRILARLAHPHIARLIDAGVLPDDRQGGAASQPGAVDAGAAAGAAELHRPGWGRAQPYLVLEYVDGETLARHCEQQALDLTARLRIFLDVLAAVGHAHNRLILHRDLKPSNILVTATGEVKLLDFGIATLLDDGTRSAATSELTQRAGRAFTPHYAAPEQLQDGDVTMATDVYALGVLLYVLLGGAHPTAAATDTALDQMRAVVEHEPERVSEAVLRRGGPAAARQARALRGDLDTIVAKALKKLPAERYANTEQLADDLGRYLNDQPIAARPDTLAYRTLKFVKRYRALVLAGGITTLALGAGAGVALWEAREATRQREQAESLVEFMLGDLRKQLQPVGRLDVLDAVGSKVLAHYAAQDADRLDADSLGRRARALHLIGEIAEQRGSLADASRVFTQAAESTAELLQRHPLDGQRVFDHAQSMYWVGYIARRRGLSAEAEAAFVTYLALARRLSQLAPGQVDWRMEPAHAGVNVGIVQLESGRAVPALKAFDDAVAVWRSVFEVRPDAGQDLANALGWEAKAHEALGDLDAAVGAQLGKIDVARGLPDFEQNRELQRLVANGQFELGRLQLMRGETRLGLTAAQQALAGFEALRAIDANNLDWLAQATFAGVNVAEMQLLLGNAAAASDQLPTVERNLVHLLSVDRTRSKWNVALRGQVLLLKAHLAPYSGRQQTALRRELESFLADTQRSEAAGQSLDQEQGRIVAGAMLTLGDLLAHDAQRAAALECWRDAAARMEGFATAGNAPAMVLLAQARLRLGDTRAAQALANAVDSTTYRHPAYVELTRQLAH